MFRIWKDDWLCSGSLSEKSHVVLSRLFENGELRVLIEFHGTVQRYFYTLTRFEQGGSRLETGRFQSLDEAKAAA